MSFKVWHCDIKWLGNWKQATVLQTDLHRHVKYAHMLHLERDTKRDRACIAFQQYVPIETSVFSVKSHIVYICLVLQIWDSI